MKYYDPSELWGTNSLAVRSQYECSEYCDRKIFLSIKFFIYRILFVVRFFFPIYKEHYLWGMGVFLYCTETYPPLYIRINGTKNGYFSIFHVFWLFLHIFVCFLHKVCVFLLFFSVFCEIRVFKMGYFELFWANMLLFWM